MSIRRWCCCLAPTLCLLALPAYAERPETAGTKAEQAAPPTDTPAARRAPGAAAAPKGKPAREGRAAPSANERGNKPAEPPAGERAAGDHAHGDHAHDDHAHDQPGRPDMPSRAAIQALMKAQALTEEQAIAHLRSNPNAEHGAAADEAEMRRLQRQEIRRERARVLRGRLKSRGIPNQLRVELQTHARRLAQCERLRELAAKDTKMVARIDAMLAKENERHERRMTRLIDDANQAPEGAAAPADPAAAPAPAEAPAAAPTPAPAQKPTEGATP